MNDPDNFISRWSRRKLGSDADKSPAENSGEHKNEQTASRNGQAEPTQPKDGAGPSPEFDITRLPPVESINAGTDISAFLEKGVPTALRHAALRRAWSTDPAIRDHIGLNENFWDAAGPDGIPGFGELDPGLDVQRMVSELFGETTPDKSEPEQRASAAAPAQSAEISETADDQHKMRVPSPPQSASEQTHNGAAQKKVTEEAPIQKMTRRHGGAMPE